MKMPGEIRRDEAIAIDVDDYIIALELADDMCGREHPSDIVRGFAQWVATLREHYVEIGRVLTNSEHTPSG